MRFSDCSTTTSARVTTFKRAPAGASSDPSPSGTVSEFQCAHRRSIRLTLPASNADRVTAHSALVDWHDGMDGKRRHGARLTPQAERPFL